MNYIVKNEEIMSGIPVIAGTRVPIERIKILLDKGYSEENLRKEFPKIKVRIIRGALSEVLDMGLKHLAEKHPR